MEPPWKNHAATSLFRSIALALGHSGGKNVPPSPTLFRKIFSGSVHYDFSWYLRILL